MMGFFANLVQGSAVRSFPISKICGPLYDAMNQGSIKLTDHGLLYQPDRFGLVRRNNRR